MYKAFTAQEFKKMLSLPDDYHIDGLLTYGAWDEPKHHSRLCEAMDGLGIKYSAKLLEGFLLHALEIKMETATVFSVSLRFQCACGGSPICLRQSHKRSDRAR